MGLGPEVINLIWSDLLDDANQICGVRQIAIMQEEPHIRFMPIHIQMIDPVSIETGSPAFDAVDFVSFFEEQLSQVRSVLPGDSGDECFFHFYQLPIF
jgi:hypothetical protein